MAFLLVSSTFNAQNDINFDVNSTDGTGWIGFMNVFNKPADGGVFQFGSNWGVPDLVAVVDAGANTVTLKPNRIGDTNSYWQTTGVLEGNKIMNASFYLERDDLAGTSFTFNAEVVSNTLNSAGLSEPFVATAFINVFSSDYSNLAQYPIAIANGNFTISLDASQSVPGDHIQYGFRVVGVNINSNSAFDAQYEALGSIVIGENTILSVDDNSLSNFNVYPNPTVNNWNIKSNQSINSIQLFDVLGKQVMLLNPNSREVSIETSGLQAGLYFATVKSLTGSKTMKLIKQ